MLTLPVFAVQCFLMSRVQDVTGYQHGCSGCFLSHAGGSVCVPSEGNRRKQEDLDHGEN